MSCCWLPCHTEFVIFLLIAVVNADCKKVTYADIYLDTCPATDFDRVKDMKAMRSVIKNMKAIQIAQFGGPSVLKVNHQVPVPEPGENQILMKVSYAGINPVDTYIREGAYSRVPDLPYTPGDDAAGTVAKVGTNVTEFEVGDRIFCARSLTGVCAEYTVVDKHYTWPLGKCLSFKEGAALGIPYFTAQRALFLRAKAKATESVLVHGASGAVGVATCQLAQAAGLTVYGTAGTPEGSELVLKAGAKQVFNHREDGYTDKILEATGGKGVDIIIEMLANKNLAKDLTLLGRHGRVMVLGSRGALNMDPRLTMGKETSIMGVALFTSELEDWKVMGEEILAGIEAGAIKPFVDLEFPLENIADAHKEVMEHSTGGAKGKIVIKVSD